MRSTAIRHIRLRLDVDWADLALGMVRCLIPTAPARVIRELADCWPEPHLVVPCLSVRSGFDLLLSSVDWPPGSEVLMSGITIPQMAVLVRSHGFTPVAIDVDPQTLLVDPAAVRRCVGPRTRALVYSHLFGTRADLTTVSRLCRDTGLMLIEDRAQSYPGATEPLGDAEVAMYSFGTIKTATSLGGAVMLVRDPELRRAVVDRQAGYPTQSRSAYLIKLLKACLMLGLAEPRLFAIFTRLAQLTGLDYDRTLRSLSRSFTGNGLLDHIRRRPCTALLSFMCRRFTTYDSQRVERRQRTGERYAALLRADCELLGGRAPEHTYWLFPVLSVDPEAVVARGRSVGFDVTRGSSVLVALDPTCTDADWAMRHVVYLPLHPALDEIDTERLIAAVSAAETAARLEAAEQPDTTRLARGRD